MTTTSPACTPTVSPLRTAEGDLRATAHDDQHLVRDRVVVVVGEDAVYPRPSPAVPGEKLFGARGGQITPRQSLRHRCALCGIRVSTPDGRTAVTAAHIVPWSVTHDDRPANGMALCRMCHWVFDEGLMRVSSGYEILASPHLNVADNLPGYLTNLEGRGILGPSRRPFWPDVGSLRWHRENVFRSG